MGDPVGSSGDVLCSSTLAKQVQFSTVQKCTKISGSGAQARSVWYHGSPRVTQVIHIHRLYGGSGRIHCGGRRSILSRLRWLRSTLVLSLVVTSGEYRHDLFLFS